MADGLNETQQTLLDCVTDALAMAGRPVCQSYAVIGEPTEHILPGGCCECEPGKTGEALAAMERIFEADPQTLLPVDRVRPCKGGIVAADMTILVTRCYPTIDSRGNLPSPGVADEKAAALGEDVSDVWQALTCCLDVHVRIREIATDSSPDAGCSALAARVTVEVNPRPTSYSS